VPRENSEPCELEVVEVGGDGDVVGGVWVGIAGEGVVCEWLECVVLVDGDEVGEDVCELLGERMWCSMLTTSCLTERSSSLMVRTSQCVEDMADLISCSLSTLSEFSFRILMTSSWRALVSAVWSTLPSLRSFCRDWRPVIVVSCCLSWPFRRFFVCSLDSLMDLVRFAISLMLSSILWHVNSATLVV